MQFQSLNRAYKRSDAESLKPRLKPGQFQSLNRAYKRSDPASYPSAPNDYKKFQSLNRAYKRSDGALVNPRGTTGHVSIPQSGLQAFRHLEFAANTSGLACFNPSIGLTSVPTPGPRPLPVPSLPVSIPQSGLQAFRPLDVD